MNYNIDMINYHINEHRVFWMLLALEGSTLHELVEEEYNQLKLKELCRP